MTEEGLLLVRACKLWFLAGFFTAVLSVEFPGEHSDILFPALAGGVWAVVGLLAVIVVPNRFATALQMQLRMRTSNPVLAATMEMVARALIVGGLGGYGLERWALPHLGVPEGATRGWDNMGPIVTALAHSLCIIPYLRPNRQDIS